MAKLGKGNQRRWCLRSYHGRFRSQHHHHCHHHRRRRRNHHLRCRSRRHDHHLHKYNTYAKYANITMFINIIIIIIVIVYITIVIVNVTMAINLMVMIRPVINIAIAIFIVISNVLVVLIVITSLLLDDHKKQYVKHCRMNLVYYSTHPWGSRVSSPTNVCGLNSMDCRVEWVQGNSVMRSVIPSELWQTIDRIHYDELLKLVCDEVYLDHYMNSKLIKCYLSESVPC